MQENKNIPEELKEALNRCRNAQKQLKKRQQQYCIKKYYAEKKNKN